LDTGALKQFAQDARRDLLDQVAARLEQVLRTDNVEIREQQKAVEELQRQIHQSSQEAVIEKVAYTWFNRFCALRFMDVNHYTRVGIVSPVAGFTQPEILQEAKQGVIDESFLVNRQRIFDLLGGQTPAAQPQREAYRLLLVGACNAYHKMMPFLFEPIADYTELLMPRDLLSENSILQAIRDALSPDHCRDVEVIGWLYEGYISERKDEVIGSKAKSQPEDIPAATQLFTPHWIVRFLMENSLGRLWLLNRPNSRLAESMEFYIQPEETETDFLRLNSPEAIRVCDPACGSGHMLTYAFDLLYQIYEEEGYDPLQIPRLILEKNLYGIEIDHRAGDLAAFALTMKARKKDRRFFQRKVMPNICVLENVHFTGTELDDYMEVVGRDLFTQDLEITLTQFEQADNFGSLIRPLVTNIDDPRQRLAEKGIFEDLFLHNTNQKVQQVLEQAEYLSPRYHVVVANPPYMGGKGMNADLKDFARDQYPDSKSDTFAMFIERNLELTLYKGQLGLVTPAVWMFLSSYENLRHHLIENATITGLVQLEYNAFEPAVIPAAVYALENSHRPNFKGGYVRLVEFRGAANQAPRTLEAIRNPDCGWFYRAFAADFKKIPGLPIAYWVSDRMREIFEEGRELAAVAEPRKGITTADNEKYIRQWTEVSLDKISVNSNTAVEAINSKKKWFPVNKGGNFRKWYGNKDNLINWANNGQELKDFERAVIRNSSFYFKEGMTWNDISSSNFAMRYSEGGAIFEGKGPMGFAQNSDQLMTMIAFFNSCVSKAILKFLCPTLNFNIGDIAKTPILEIILEQLLSLSNAQDCISVAKNDWDSYETSWDFTRLPMLYPGYRRDTLADNYAILRHHWQEVTQDMQRLEEENNRLFIEAYGLQEELTPDVPLSEITITCNPTYRYGGNKDEAALEARLREDTMKEFISYAVGCMFGRYSLDKPDLILANQGDTAVDYRAQIPSPTFPPDEDNVIPILDEGWFTDDITERFKVFLRLTFGSDHYEENLTFIEDSLGRDIRSYFLRDFYKDHLKTYKKRPIYWLFSSPKGSFNALIYMHRYRPDTISVILNDYLREYRVKLNAHKTHLEQVSISTGASNREKTQALKEIDQVNKILAELKEYEDDILYPLATRRLEIDLDDGVKVNYKKFGQALKNVSGLS
jgi:type II restriction/modification system DNA methylase subunit YeeA